MKIIGSILLAIGFLVGAYVTVAHVDHVDWLPYGLCAGCMLVGLIVLRRESASRGEDEGERHDQDMDILEQSLASLIEKVRVIESETGDQAQLRVYERIDSELIGDLNAFVEARESMIPRLGMQAYADIMSSFANAERTLNRAWSASADGYVDEVRRCVGVARSGLEKAGELLSGSRAKA